MWCPKCGAEYREGFTECADCHIPLVEELGDYTDTSGDSGDSAAAPGAGAGELEGSDELEMTAGQLNLTPEEMQELLEAMEEQRQIMERPAYRSVADRIDDLKSSGYTLTVAGVVGFVLLVLMFFGIIPFRLGGTGQYISYGVMGALFLVFLVSGVKSLAKLPDLRREAEREKEKEAEIRKWFLSNYDASAIDSVIDSLDEAATDKYFARAAFMREKISEHFIELDPSFTDYIIEELYSALYEGAGE